MGKKLNLEARISKDNGKFIEKDFEKPRRITEEKKERIIELYEECEGYALRSSEKLRTEGNYRHYTTIIKIWRKQGLEIRKKGTPRGSKSGTKRISSIDELIAEGLTVRKIAEKEGVSSSIIHQYIHHSGQHKEWKEAREKKKYSKRDELIAEGLTLQEIAEKEGVTNRTISGYIHNSGQYKEWKEAREKKKYSKRDELIAEGLTLREIGKKTGVTRQAIMLYINHSEQHKEWKEAREKKKYSKRDELIEEGFSLEVIAKNVRATRETITEYMKKTDQYEQWKQKNVERSNLIGSMIRQVAFQKAEEKDFAYVKALEYQFNRKKTSPDNIPFEKLLNIYQTYEDFVKEHNKPPTITELGRMTDKFPSGVKKLLQKVNLPISKDPKRGYKLSFEQREAIEFAFELDYLSIYDIAYFVGCTGITINKYFKKLGERKISDLSLENQNLSYKKASQIFEAEDAGFTKEEIIEYASIRFESRLDIILRNREDLETDLIEALKVMFPERGITNPYL